MTRDSIKREVRFLRAMLDMMESGDAIVGASERSMELRRDTERDLQAAKVRLRAVSRG